MRLYQNAPTANAGSLVLVALILGASSLCGAANIAYDVNETIGAGGIMGYIVTDGVSGILNSSDIVGFNLLLNDGTATLGISTGGVLVIGGDLSATPTHLLFDFSGTDSGFFLLQNGFIGNGNPGTCFQTASAPCSVVGGAGETVWIENFNAPQFTGVSGTKAPGSSSPEPSTLALLSVGIALGGFHKLRKAEFPQRPRKVGETVRSARCLSD